MSKNLALLLGVALPIVLPAAALGDEGAVTATEEAGGEHDAADGPSEVSAPVTAAAIDDAPSGVDPTLQARYDAALSLMNEGKLNAAEAEFKAVVAAPASEPLLSEAISRMLEIHALQAAASPSTGNETVVLSALAGTGIGVIAGVIVGRKVGKTRYDNSIRQGSSSSSLETTMAMWGMGIGAAAGSVGMLSGLMIGLSSKADQDAGIAGVRLIFSDQPDERLAGLGLYGQF